MKRSTGKEWNLVGDDLFDIWGGLDEDDLGSPEGHIEKIDDIIRQHYSEVPGDADGEPLR